MSSVCSTLVSAHAENVTTAVQIYMCAFSSVLRWLKHAVCQIACVHMVLQNHAFNTVLHFLQAFFPEPCEIICTPTFPRPAQIQTDLTFTNPCPQFCTSCDCSTWSEQAGWSAGLLHGKRFRVTPLNLLKGSENFRSCVMRTRGHSVSCPQQTTAPLFYWSEIWKQDCCSERRTEPSVLRAEETKLISSPHPIERHNWRSAGIAQRQKSQPVLYWQPFLGACLDDRRRGRPRKLVRHLTAVLVLRKCKDSKSTKYHCKTSSLTS